MRARVKRSKTSLRPGHELIGAELKEVERVLHEQSRSEVRLVMQVSDHILESGGKRFRPTALLLAARLCGYRGPRAVSYAAAIEYAHTSTLLHDDVVDEATTRRGRPSANRIWGNQTSVLVGDYLLFKGFHLLLLNENPRILEIVNQTAILMAEGEAFQLTRKKKAKLSEAEYFKIITDKTAALISVSCRIGAILGRVSVEREQALGEFGAKLGIAFQLVDDALDYAGEERAWGKKVGKDFAEGKMTLPLIHAYQRAGAGEQKRLTRIMIKPKRGAEDFRIALGLIHQYAGLEYTLERARSCVAEAKARLKIFPPHPARQALWELADFVVERTI